MPDITEPLVLHNSGFLSVLDGTIDWDDAPNVAAVLCTSGYDPQLTHATYDDLTDEVESGEGHDYEPKEVTGRQVDRVDDEVRYISDPVDFGGDVSIKARYLVLVVGDPEDLQAADPVIGHVDLKPEPPATDRTSANADFKYTPPATGWFYVTRADCPE